MSKRRAPPEEAEFGSDAFLDVISNMVGILIILILMAAFRAKQAPVTDEELVAALPQLEISDANSQIEDGGQAPPIFDSADSVAISEDRLLPPNSAEPDLDAEQALDDERQRLLTRAAQFEELSRRLEAELQDKDVQPANSSLLAAQAKQQTSDLALNKLKSALSQSLQTHGQIKASLQAEQSEIAALQQRLDELNLELRSVAQQERKKEKLAHKVTPIGLLVQGREIFFRVVRGRISSVPMLELSSLVGDKIQQNRDWLIRNNRHTGQVGPIEGYVMKYEVVRELGGPLGDASLRPGMVKLEVPRFTVEPQLNLYDEKVSESLEPEGLFVRKLAQTPPDTTVTLWIYPDSFAEYRQLSSFAQRHGFVVAARPLPTGLPITGSSHGSKSVGQ